MAVVVSPPDLELVAVAADGTPEKPLGPLPDVAVEVAAGLASLYRRVGFRPPWIGYLAVRTGAVVGTCAFKGPPAAGRAEIAYFTFPGHEGQGVAQAMARRLVGLAQRADAGVQVTAQTLPTANASNAILRKLGFSFTGSVLSPEDGEVWEWRLPGGGLRPVG